MNRLILVFLLLIQPTPAFKILLFGDTLEEFAQRFSDNDDHPWVPVQHHHTYAIISIPPFFFFLPKVPENLLHENFWLNANLSIFIQMMPLQINHQNVIMYTDLQPINLSKGPGKRIEIKTVCGDPHVDQAPWENVPSCFQKWNVPNYYVINFDFSSKKLLSYGTGLVSFPYGKQILHYVSTNTGYGFPEFIKKLIPI